MSLVLVLPNYQWFRAADPSTQNTAGMFGLPFALTVKYLFHGHAL